MNQKQITPEKVIRVSKLPDAEVFIKLQSHQHLDNCTITSSTYISTIVVHGKFWYFVEHNCNNVSIGQRTEFESNTLATEHAIKRGWTSPKDYVGLSSYKVTEKKVCLSITEDYSDIFKEFT